MCCTNTNTSCCSQDWKTRLASEDVGIKAESHVLNSIKLRNQLVQSPHLLSQIERLGELAGTTLERRGTIFLAGNGGSFADAQHIAAEFLSKLMTDRCPLPAIALGTNSSSMSAIGNDYGYEYVFAREIRALAREGDLLIPISTSGNSPNIIKAAIEAAQLGLSVCGLTGETGGRLKDVCDCIQVPSESTALIQECHIMIGHIVCAIAETTFLMPQT